MARRVAIIGAGLIARQVVDFLRDLRWHVEEVVVHDLDPSRAVALAERMRSTTLVGAAPVRPSDPGPSVFPGGSAYSATGHHGWSRDHIAKLDRS
ncbi:hypothetical protein [Cutibacterium avidum]|nr:hypothetical protein [Cutibacterium avidum]